MIDFCDTDGASAWACMLAGAAHGAHGVRRHGGEVLAGSHRRDRRGGGDLRGVKALGSQRADRLRQRRWLAMSEQIRKFIIQQMNKKANYLSNRSLR